MTSSSIRFKVKKNVLKMKELYVKILLFDLTIFGIVIIGYWILNKGFRKNRARGQNFLTWFLWGIIDLILYIKIKEISGFATVLALAEVFGCFITSIYILYFYTLRYRRIIIKYNLKTKILIFIRIVLKKWTRNESRTGILTGILIVMLFFVKETRSIIALGVLAEMAAGWPLLKETWKDPDPSGYTLTSYLVFLLGYILAIYKCFAIYPINEVFGETFIENMFFPIAFIIYSVFDTFPLIRIWLKKYKKNS